MRVLVVEDSRRLAGIIKRGLLEEAYTVDNAYDGEEAQYMAESTPFDLIVLDIMLPKKDGLAVCRDLRAKNVNALVLYLGNFGMIAAGLGYLSEDRQGEGLALSRSIVDNLTLSRFEPFVRFGWLSLKRQRQAGWEWVRRMNIKARSPLQEVAHLSGGNQQKVALARLLHQNAEIFLMDEPTRGIDIGSKSQIYECMSGLAKEGKSVLFVSSYFPELLGVCDRIAVFHRGQLVDTRPSPGWTEESLLAAATTGRAAAEP